MEASQANLSQTSIEPQDPSSRQRVTHVGHGDSDIAYHVEWDFRKEAVRWENGNPIAPNFHPLGTELYQWLLRKGPLSIFAEHHKRHPQAYTNPYTYHCSCLAAVLTAALNDSHAIATSTEDKEP